MNEQEPISNAKAKANKNAPKSVAVGEGSKFARKKKQGTSPQKHQRSKRDVSWLH